MADNAAASLAARNAATAFELPVRSKAWRREAEGVIVYVTRSKVSPVRVGSGLALRRKKLSLKGLGL